MMVIGSGRILQSVKESVKKTLGSDLGKKCG